MKNFKTGKKMMMPAVEGDYYKVSKNVQTLKFILNTWCCLYTAFIMFINYFAN